jgi:xyloglucan-specific exo-beta-1,4-glucanase
MLNSKLLMRVATIITILIVTLSSVQSGLARISYASTGTVPPGQWVPIGPTLMQGPSKEFITASDPESGQFNATGRLMTVAVDPYNPGVIYVGSPGADGNEGSGVWKTIDAGNSWAPIADSLPSTAVSAIAIDPTNPNRVFIVLFEEGLYRSDDAGMSWTHIYGDLHIRTNLGEDGNRTVLLINPLDPGTLYLTTDLGVLRSQDGGDSWAVSLGKDGATSVEGGATSLVMDSQDPGVLYAAISNPAWDPNYAAYRTQAVYKTIDGGDSWNLAEQLPSGLLPWRNILLAITHPSGVEHETVYALFPRGPIIDNDGGLFGGIGYDLFRTTDGDNWSKQFACYPDPNDHWISYYNCSFAVMTANPAEPDTVYLGGADLFLSFDGGATFEPVPTEDTKRNLQPYAPHVDYWQLVTDPFDSSTLYAASDGGIYRSSDHGKNGTWNFIGQGITNAELTDIALAATDPNRMMGAMQDNGTSLFDRNKNNGLVWEHFECCAGDGGVSAIDPTDAGILYQGGRYPWELWQRVGGGDWEDFTNGLPKPKADYFPPCATYDLTFNFQVHPTVPTTLFASCISLYRTTTNIPPGQWTTIFTPSEGQVVRSTVDPIHDLVYVGTNRGQIFRGPALGTAIEDWPKVFAHPTGLQLSDIEVDSRREIVYVSFAPHMGGNQNCAAVADRVYKLAPTLPGGQLSSSNITGDLPAGLCVNALAIDPHIPRTVYAATTRGVYRGRSNATGEIWVWEAYNNGMPSTYVIDLEVHPLTGHLVAATYGRAAFELVPETVLPISIDIKPGTSENTINIKNKGKIPVAILSSVTFDAPNEVDKTSLTFGSTGNEASLVLCDQDPQDVNGDGLLDQVCNFSTSLTGFQLGDTVGFLKGLTVEGTPIEGSETVRILNR